MSRIIAAILAVTLGFLSTSTHANEVTQTQQYQNGQLVQSSDLSGDQEAMRNLTGISVTMLLGGAQNALPMSNPLAITASPSFMTFSIGGTGQFVLAKDTVSGNSRVIDSCPLQGFTIPNNPGPGVRTDLLSIQYQQPLTNGHQVSFNTGIKQTVFSALEGCGYNYLVGSTSTPPGYLGFATIAVPPGATTASSATITYLFKTIGKLILAELGGTIVTGVVAGTGVTVSGTDSVPVVGLSHGDYVDTTSVAQAKIGPLSATSLSATGLPPGLCVQTGSAGTLGVASGPCGLGSGTLTSVSAGTGIAVTGAGSSPTVGLSHGDYLDQSATPQTKLGTLSLSNGLTISSGNLGMSSGSQGAYLGYVINTQGNYYAGNGASVCLNPNQATTNQNCVDVNGNFGTHTLTANQVLVGASSLSASGASIGGNVMSSNGVFGALPGIPVQLCPNNTCGGTFVDASQNFHANIVNGTQFNGSGAGLSLHTIPDASLVSTPVTGFLNGPGISISGPPTATTVSNVGVTSLAGIGNIATTGTTGGINVSSNLLFDSNSGVYRPTGVICSGSAITNGSSQATVSCGAHIYGATATLFDTSYVNFFWLRVQSISGGSVTFGVGNQAGNPQGAGVGFYYTVSSYL